MKIVSICYKRELSIMCKGNFASLTFCLSVRCWRIRPELVRLLVGY